jgi:hypothetical protein
MIERVWRVKSKEKSTKRQRSKTGGRKGSERQDKGAENSESRESGRRRRKRKGPGAGTRDT